MPSKLLHFLYDDINQGYFTLSYKSKSGAFNTYWYPLASANEVAYFDTMQQLVTVADENGNDVYVSTGTALHAPDDSNTGKKRISLSMCYAVPALFMDIDTMADPEKMGKGKTALPATPEAAVQVLSKLACAPSLCICSGYGVHAYWKLQTAYVIKSDDDRANIKNVMRLFAQHIAHETGWTDMDTFASEPTRILRLDGTHNHKRNDIRPVGVIYQGASSYSLQEIEKLLCDEKHEEPATPTNQNPSIPIIGTKDYMQIGLSDSNSILSRYWYGYFDGSDESKNDCALMRQIIRRIGRDEDACLAAFDQSPYCAKKDSAHSKKWKRASYRHGTFAAALRQFDSMGWETSAEKDARYQATRAKAETRPAKQQPKQQMIVHQAVPTSPVVDVETEETNEQNAIITRRDKEPLTASILAEYMSRTGRTARMDIIKNQVRFDGKTASGKRYDFDSMLTVLEDELRVANAYSNVNDRSISSKINYIARENSYNPVLEHLDSLTWDNVDRMPAFFNLVGISTTDDLSKILVRKWLYECYAALHNTEEHPFPVDGVLCLIGNQGSGKTSLFAALSLKTEWFLGGACINDKDKDTIIRATSNWITELGEVGSTMKSDIDSLKAFLTLSYDQYRLPYGRADRKSPRHTCFCATTNESEYLIDTTGNRRFWTVPTTSNTSIDSIKAFDFEQLWAQVIVQVKETGLPYNLCFHLTETEKERLNTRNDMARKPVPAEEQIIDILAKVENQGGAYWEQRLITVTDWQMQFATLSKYKANQIAKALKMCGKIQQSITPVRGSDGKVRRLHLLPCRKTYE